MPEKENDVVALLVARFGFGKRYAQRIVELMGPDGVKQCEAGDFSAIPRFNGKPKPENPEPNDSGE